MKGILFKPWKIQFIAEHPDMEIQTRRVEAALKGINEEPNEWGYIDCIDGKFGFDHTSPDGSIIRVKVAKPRYQVGETVYLKEAHYHYGEWRKNGLTKTGRQKWLFHPMPEMITISAIKGEESLRYYDNPPSEVKHGSYRKEGWYKRSPLFMPEWAARHFITITDVRAERLQEISLPECEAEGFALVGYEQGCSACDTKSHSYYGGRFHFEQTWNSINKDYPFESNPWVWVYTFRRQDEQN